jgi:hypothetical protein
MTDKSLHILHRQYDKLKFGDYFYIKWTLNNFVFCNSEGKSLRSDGEYNWEDQVFILSTKLMDKPVVLLGGCKFATGYNNALGVGTGFGSATRSHIGYDDKSYAIYCYHLPDSENISRLFLVQKNGKLIYVTNEEHGLWKTVEDIYKIADKTLFKITLTRLGWNISTNDENSNIDIQTKYITNENVATFNQIEEMVLKPQEIVITNVKIDKNDSPFNSRYEERIALIRKFREQMTANDQEKNQLVFKKHLNNLDDNIVDHRVVKFTNMDK